METITGALIIVIFAQIVIGLILLNRAVAAERMANNWRKAYEGIANIYLKGNKQDSEQVQDADQAACE